MEIHAIAVGQNRDRSRDADRHIASRESSSLSRPIAYKCAAESSMVCRVGIGVHLAAKWSD